MFHHIHCILSNILSNWWFRHYRVSWIKTNYLIYLYSNQFHNLHGSTSFQPKIFLFFVFLYHYFKIQHQIPSFRYRLSLTDIFVIDYSHTHTHLHTLSVSLSRNIFVHFWKKMNAVLFSLIFPDLLSMTRKSLFSNLCKKYVDQNLT